MRTTVVILGAGHSGLAMSHCLNGLSIDHLVVERGEVANSWKRERWDSLRLLTPNWQSKLPGFEYRGDRPDDYMSMPEVIGFIEGYARSFSAPVKANTLVRTVRRSDYGYDVTTTEGVWQCLAVVIATGACNVAAVPKVAAALAPSIRQVTPLDYRSPAQLDPGGVLVVGASATGVQLAAEIHASGRPVTLAVGEHVRLPRMYRGRDIFWWMDAAGLLDTRYDEVDDLVRARHVPSPQLVGTSERLTLDLNALTTTGIELCGRVANIRDTLVQFSGSLKNVCALADLKMKRLLGTIDGWAEQAGRETELPEAERHDATRVPETPRLELDLAKAGIKTVLWATGYRADYSWLEVPVLDHKGKVRHVGGVVDSPGMYLLGDTFLRRRKSSFIHGAADDAQDLAAHLAGFLAKIRGT